MPIHRRRIRRQTVIFIATLAGLFILLALPVVSHLQMQRFHSVIDDRLSPANVALSDILTLAHEARSYAMSYRLHIPEPVPPGFENPRAYYMSLLERWKEAPRLDRRLQSVDAEAYVDFQAGMADIDGWLQNTGPAMFDARPLDRTALAQNTVTYARGIHRLHQAQDHLRDTGRRLRNQMVDVDRRQMQITAPLALVCILLAGLSWQTLAQLRRSEERLQVSIRETNHRVKNNLQVVASLLDMHIQDVGAGSAREELADIAGQVRAMGAVHDLLSKEGTGAAASDALLHTLAEQVGRSAGLEVESAADEVELTTKQAVAVGLIANELLLNAGKHGATRSILQFCASDGAATLRVRDNGKGFPEGFDPERDANLGLDLVRSLALHDLHGTVDFRNDHGASITVAFPLNGAA